MRLHCRARCCKQSPRRRRADWLLKRSRPPGGTVSAVRSTSRTLPCQPDIAALSPCQCCGFARLQKRTPTAEPCANVHEVTMVQPHSCMCGPEGGRHCWPCRGAEGSGSGGGAAGASAPRRGGLAGSAAVAGGRALAQAALGRHAHGRAGGAPGRAQPPRPAAQPARAGGHRPHPPGGHGPRQQRPDQAPLHGRWHAGA